MLVSRARRSEGGGRERLVTVVDFPCAIAECCDVQLDYSIRNNEVRIYTYACRFIAAYFPRDNMCYVTANEIPRAHGKSTTVTRRSLPPPPPPERLARETMVMRACSK